MCLIHLRALVRAGIERIADSSLSRARCALLHELVIYLFFDEHARAGAATLAMVKEQPHVRALDGLIHVGVGKDDVRALAAQFQRDALQIGFSRRLLDEMPHFGGTGEGNFVDVHVARDSGAGGGAKAGKNIHHACREAGFYNQLADP